MKTLFFFFTIFLLLIFELWLGSLSLYMPFMWMGFFYFAICRYPSKLLTVTGVIAVILLDLILYRRLWLPDFFVAGTVCYLVWRFRNFWQQSIWSGGLAGILLVLFAYTIQFIACAFSHGFSVMHLTDSAAQMTALLPPGFLLQTFLIYIADKVQKKLRFEQFFVVDKQSNSISIYRRRGEYSR